MDKKEKVETKNEITVKWLEDVKFNLILQNAKHQGGIELLEQIISYMNGGESNSK